MKLAVLVLIPILVGWTPPPYRSTDHRVSDLEQRMIELEQQIWELTVCCSTLAQTCDAVGYR